MQKPHDVLSVFRDFEAFLKCTVDVQTTVPGTSTCTCTQRAVFSLYRTKCRKDRQCSTRGLYEFDDVRLFACCALNSELRYSRFTPTFE